MTFLSRIGSLTLLIVTILSITACNNSKGGGGNPSSFEGQWLEEGILEFRENKSDQFICDRIEKSNGNYELTIDGFNVDSAGNVRDFSLYGESQVIWKVRPDGSTYDNIYLNLEVEGTEGIESNSMKLTDENTLVNTWKFKVSNPAQTSTGVVYVRTNSEEIANLKGIVESCPKK